MPSYLVLGNWTDQGIRNIKGGPQRLEAAKEAAQAAGGRIVFFYMTMGQYDLAALIELPDDEAAASNNPAVAAKPSKEPAVDGKGNPPPRDAALPNVEKVQQAQQQLARESARLALRIARQSEPESPALKQAMDLVRLSGG